MQLRGSLAVIVVINAFVGVAAEEAHACGGLFCSQSSPTPVDQAAERILFEVLDDGSVSATVEIKYEGNPAEFSWIVPVSGTPDFVEVAGKDELQLLDLATAPTFLPPTPDCPGFGGGGGFGFYGCATEDLSAPISDAVGIGENGPGGVNVVEYPSVGPFDEIVVVDGGSADVLMAWLNDHGYRVNEAMRPFIADYIDEGYSFLATQLRADATVQDMAPIRFHCPQPNPEIPLRLTAISAEPEMGFLVFVAGSERYAALNYDNVVIDAADLRNGVDKNGTPVSNYFGLISQRLDEAGGQGFVTERADVAANVANGLANVFLGTETEAASRAHLDEVLRNRAFVTRFYARMNPEEMTVDPIFSDAGNSAVVNGVLDLSSQRTGVCGLEQAPTCGTRYCGDGDACAVADLDVEGCVCRGDHVARLINSPTGGADVVCTPPAIDLHASGGDICAGNACGAGGECVPLNDRPTCRCDDDHVAIVDSGAIRCARRDGKDHEAATLVWPAVDDEANDDNGDDDGGCGALRGSTSAGGIASLALLLFSSLALRRLRRR